MMGGDNSGIQRLQSIFRKSGDRFSVRKCDKRKKARAHSVSIETECALVRLIPYRYQIEKRIDEFVSDFVEQRFRAPCYAQFDVPPAGGGQRENRSFGADLEVLSKVGGAESACRLPSISR